MPIYVYKCEKCGKVVEKLVSLKKKKKHIKCLNCGNKAFLNVGLTNVIFKGSGFYETDYKNKD